MRASLCVRVSAIGYIRPPSSWRGVRCTNSHTHTHTARAQPYGGVEFLAAGECISLFPAHHSTSTHYGCDFMGGNRCDIMRGDNFRQTHTHTRMRLHECAVRTHRRARCRSLNCIIANGNIIQIARLSWSASACVAYLMQL